MRKPAADADLIAKARILKQGRSLIVGDALVGVANAIFKIALPPAPWDMLMGFTALYLSPYMGGHTVKSVFATWRGPR